MTTTKPKILLLDGNSLANRAFYSMPLLSNAEGQFTNAVYGFLLMYLKLLDDEQPDYVVVAFDKSGPTFRHVKFEEYKGTRKGAPDEFRPQLQLLRDVLSELGVAWVQIGGYEADDLIGTLAKQAGEKDLHAIIVTGDKDSLQLIDENTTVYLTKKGVTDIGRMDPAALKEMWGITPPQVCDLKGLMGDASDNIPGIPGVGEKTALKLLEEFGSVENVLAHADQVKGKLGERLREHADLARLSKELATIECCVPDLELDLGGAKCRDIDPAVAAPLFRRLELKSLLNRLPGPDLSTPAVQAALDLQAAAAVNIVYAADAADAAQKARACLQNGELVLLPIMAPAKDPGLPAPAGIAIAGADHVLWVADAHLEGLRELWADAALVGHGLKPMVRWLVRQAIKPRVAFDTELAAYLLDPARNSYDLVDLLRGHDLGDLPAGPTPEQAAPRAAALGALREKLQAQLDENELTDLYCHVELPVLPLLAELEAAGIRVDHPQLGVMSANLGQRIDQLTREIYSLAGYEFNINSPKQLAEVLFDKLGLPVLKKTKTGPSTDAEVLDELEPLHEIVAKILDFRTLVKLKGTYVDALPPLVAGDGRIHTTYNQTVAATGRLSSQDPNLQNIPIRLEEGRTIRKVFVAPGDDWMLLAADYSQIELRVVAHYSKDHALLDAFRTDQDIHTRTAAEVFGVPMSAVTKEMRRQAKAVNFGLIYGQTDFGLARSVGINRKEAKQFIENYFRVYPGVRVYMDSKIAEAKEKGYVTTLLGRKRLLPEINHRIYNIRQNAERMAINTPVQGTAADMMKLAMLQVAERLKTAGLSARMLLQVHDELVFEVHRDEVQALGRLVAEAMEGAMELDVPLKVEAKFGPNWYDMQPLEGLR